MAAQTTLNLTAMNSALRELYDGQALVELSYKNNPFWALLEKKEDFFGKNHPVPLMISPSAGVGNVFANAQANQAAPEIDSFLVTRVQVYGIAPVSREALMASASNEGAFLSAVKVNVNSTMRGVTNLINSQLFRDGTGIIGTASGSVTSGVVNLVNPQDIVNFELHQAIGAVASSSQRGALGYIISINRAAGQFTVSTTLTGSAGTPSNWGDSGLDDLVIDGTYNKAISGLAAWLPATAPSDTFFGVARAADQTRLGGCRYDGSAQPIEEALIDAASLVTREGGMPDLIVLGPASYANLVKSLAGRIFYVRVGGDAEWSFSAIEMNIPGCGAVKVIQDRSCPSKVGYVLQMDTWCAHSLGPAPEVQTDLVTGNMLRMASSDAGELRVSAYMQLECNAPGFNCTVKLSA